MRRPFKTSAFVTAVMMLSMSPAALADGSTTFSAVSASGPTSLRATVVVAGTGLTRSLTIEEHGSGETGPVRAYDVDMEKRMHLIVVSDDLGRFMHIHPALGPDGRFRITTEFPGPGTYHLFADAVPSKYGHVIFRFDLPIEAQAGPPAPRRFSPIAVAAFGDYVVRLSTDRVQAGVDTPVIVSIMKDGEPASDLHPYLGAYAHIVAIGARDLSYTHVHAMAMGSMESDLPADSAPSMAANASVPAAMPVHVTLPRPGVYKVWVQFIGGSRLYVATFVIEAT